MSISVLLTQKLNIHPRFKSIHLSIRCSLNLEHSPTTFHPIQYRFVIRFLKVRSLAISSPIDNPWLQDGTESFSEEGTGSKDLRRF
ncbi:hypothetical protein AVEN_241765-1 [Araneus ventricosus]|uniref:Uncharacterized protein n=1 Tax=Araneus ventricosus TaxID=182803 RepID=A0A4Y2FI91_ARAVE|nr:hypothetical protein AVEN_241765-1 [Araneus ventricosus]